MWVLKFSLLSFVVNALGVCGLILLMQPLTALGWFAFSILVFMVCVKVEFRKVER